MLKYEEKLEELKESDIRKEIWKRKKRRIGILNEYDKERMEVWKKLEIDMDLENIEQEERKYIKCKKRANEMVREDDLEKIRESRYVEKLKEFMHDEWGREEVPIYIRENKYLKKLARFRIGNEYEECKHWKKDEEKLYRVCKKKTESPIHVFEECEMNRCKKKVKEVLKEDGSGIGFIKGIEWLRIRNEEGKKVGK